MSDLTERLMATCSEACAEWNEFVRVYGTDDDVNVCRLIQLGNSLLAALIEAEADVKLYKNRLAAVATEHEQAEAALEEMTKQRNAEFKKWTDAEAALEEATAPTYLRCPSCESVIESCPHCGYHWELTSDFLARHDAGGSDG